MTIDPTLHLRQRVLRRTTFALNAEALRNDRVPPDGPFDTAVSNGLAAIADHEFGDGANSIRSAKRVPPASKLINKLRSTAALDAATLDALGVGLKKSQAFRHGRADDEWETITGAHVDAVLALDDHPALGVLERANGKTFEGLVVELFNDETDEYLPFDPKERWAGFEPEECPECGRETLIVEMYDEFGHGPADGSFCIACGYVRSHDEVIGDALRLRMERPD